jgi:hypothetical protein
MRFESPGVSSDRSSTTSSHHQQTATQQNSKPDTRPLKETETHETAPLARFQMPDLLQFTLRIHLHTCFCLPKSARNLTTREIFLMPRHSSGMSQAWLKAGQASHTNNKPREDCLSRLLPILNPA